MTCCSIADLRTFMIKMPPYNFIEEAKLPLLFFPDDAIYHYSSMSPVGASAELQCQLDVLPDWLRKWLVAISFREILRNLLNTQVHVRLPV